MLSTIVLWQSIYYARFLWYREIDAMYNHFRYEEEGAVEPGHPVLEYKEIVVQTIGYIKTYETILMFNLQIGVCQVMRKRATIDVSRRVFGYLLDALHPEKKCKKSHATYFGIRLPDGNSCCTSCDEARLQVMDRTMCRMHPLLWPCVDVAPEYDKLPFDILESHVSWLYLPDGMEPDEHGYASFYHCLTGEFMYAHVQTEA